VDVFEAFEVDTVYVSGEPTGTLTYNTFVRGVRYEGSKVEVVKAGRSTWPAVRTPVPSRSSTFQTTKSAEPRLRVRLTEAASEMEVALV
jgi:hypothetical protein